MFGVRQFVPFDLAFDAKLGAVPAGDHAFIVADIVGDVIQVPSRNDGDGPAEGFHRLGEKRGVVAGIFDGVGTGGDFDDRAVEIGKQGVLGRIDIELFNPAGVGRLGRLKSDELVKAG